jgi:predicted glutamine amidotransferase
MRGTVPWVMCELLALSMSQPTQLSFSLHTLAARGSAAGTTHDGWGVAFYQGRDVALFREPGAAADSALVRLLESEGPASRLAISHIRHATRGAVSLPNTQPFVRELGGRMHVFAHNGNLPAIEQAAGFALEGRFRPVGETDSEHAFCVLLERLHAPWAAATPPSLETRLSVLAAFAAGMRAFGPANFIYADGDAVFAHGHRRIQRGSGRIEPPGLWMLQRHCPPAGLRPETRGGVAIADADRAVTWFASVPLTDEDWRPLAEGELLVARDGELLRVGG